jgi:hypothetical protein
VALELVLDEVGLHKHSAARAHGGGVCVCMCVRVCARAHT